jgi:hypothetical protein
MASCFVLFSEFATDCKINSKLIIIKKSVTFHRASSKVSFIHLDYIYTLCIIVAKYISILRLGVRDSMISDWLNVHED